MRFVFERMKSDPRRDLIVYNNTVDIFAILNSKNVLHRFFLFYSSLTCWESRICLQMKYRIICYTLIEKIFYVYKLSKKKKNK